MKVNATTNINKEDFIVELHKLAKLDLEDSIYGIFMDQEIFELVLSDSEVKLKLEPKDLVGAAAPYFGIDVFYMPEEEKLLGGRKWFVVTEKQYDEYMEQVRKVKELALPSFNGKLVDVEPSGGDEEYRQFQNRWNPKWDPWQK